MCVVNILFYCSEIDYFIIVVILFYCSEMNYFIVVDILFYCDIYIILLY